MPIYKYTCTDLLYAYIPNTITYTDGKTTNDKDIMGKGRLKRLRLRLCLRVWRGSFWKKGKS